MHNDFRLALRALRRAPVFTFAAIGTLALGVAANTAIFSLFYQVLLRNLAVPAPERLVLLHSDPPYLEGGMSADNMETVFSNPMYRSLAARAREFEGLAARSHNMVEVLRSDGSDREPAEIVSGNFFQVLGMRPAAGRLLLPSDDQPNAPNVAVLSFSYWMKRFGGSRSALNSIIRVNGTPVTIVGVAPQSFWGFLSNADIGLFMPMAMKPVVSPGWQGLDDPGSQWLTVFGRMRAGVPRLRALASLQPVWKATLRDHVDRLNIKDQEYRVHCLAKTLELHSASQGINQLEAEWRKPLNALLAMVGFLLLIACANVASLLLARAAVRARETAVRVAIGASRWRVVRQSLAENIVIGVAGAVLGFALSFALLRVLIAALPKDLAGDWLSLTPDAAVLEFSLLLLLVTVSLFGLTPAVLGARLDPMPTLKEQAASVSGAGSHTRLRRLLVVGQLALSLALLTAAGFFSKTLFNLLDHDPGFNPERLITFSIDPKLSGYSLATGSQLYHDLQARLHQLPNVTAVSNARFGPLSHNRAMTNINVEGYTPRTEDDGGADINAVGAGYFRALGTPLLAGREFSDSDRETAPKVAVVNQAFARHFFHGESPVGKHMQIGAGGKLDIEIVGLVKDVNTQKLREPQDPAYYIPLHQSLHNMHDFGKASFFVRSRANPEQLEKDIRAVARQLAPNVPLFDFATMRTLVDDSVYTERLSAMLAVIFGGLAALLAAVGLYGVIAYSVARRTTEIGIRLALGALPSQVMKMVMKEVTLLALLALAAGIPLGFALVRYMSSQLYGVQPNDWQMFASASGVIVLCALAAGFVPAHRASLVDPKQALRYE